MLVIHNYYRMTVFEELIAEFAEKTGQEMQPGKDGAISLDVDNELVTVQWRPEKDDVVMFTFPCGDMPPERATMKKALELTANGIGTKGHILGLVDDVFVLSGFMKLSGATVKDFATRLIALAETARNVSSMLGRAVAESAESTQSSDESRAFMQSAIFV